MRLPTIPGGGMDAVWVRHAQAHANYRRHQQRGRADDAAGAPQAVLHREVVVAGIDDDEARPAVVYRHVDGITTGMDVVLLGLRLTLGVMIFLHGWNHLFGPGGVDGTAGWFASLGFRPAKVCALMSGYVELAVAVGLVVGLLTPVACAGLVGTMFVAGWTAHRPNGFFIFKDGYEYVLVVAVAAIALAAFGPGTWSMDNVIGLVDYENPGAVGLGGGLGALIAAAGGLAGGILLLVVHWRPGSVAKTGDAGA